MTPEQLALLADARLSDAARILGLHISLLPDGEHELSHDALAALLYGTPNTDTVGRHLRQLVVHGYMERTSAGGKGSPRYRWSARENSRATISARENSRGEIALPAKIHGESAPPSPTTTDPSPPPPPTARVHARPSDVEVARLRDHLGEHTTAVDMMLDSADHPTNWIAAVLGKYGPSGTQQRAFTGIPPDRWSAVLATALMEYATAGKPYGNQHFDGFIRKAAENERRPPAERRATGTDGRRADRPDAAAVGGETGQPARGSRYKFHYE